MIIETVLKLAMDYLQEIVLATTNAGKLSELREMLSHQSLRIKGLAEFDRVEPAVEDGLTFAENARKKAQYYSRILGRVVLADDSGLEVAALDGKPGVYSARFADEKGTENRQQQDQANNNKLMKMLENVPPGNRQARFCCCLCLAAPDKILAEVEGFLPGVILDTPQGSNGFGYDPIFFVPEKDMTVAQMSTEQKNRISHRSVALNNLIEDFSNLFKELRNKN